MTEALLSIDNLPDRCHIPILLRQLGLNGMGAELGVAKARYAKILLQVSNLKILYGIDRWCDRRHNKKQYRQVRAEAKKWGGRFIIMRKSFKEAAELFDDEFFDFVFIDGYAHKGQHHGTTMEQWWPKVRSGGIMAIHDYTPRYPENVKCINRWTEQNKISGYVTKEHKPSWITQKVYEIGTSDV